MLGNVSLSRRIPIAAILVAIGSLIFSSVVLAWDSPTDLSAPGQNAEVPRIVIDPFGNATAIWDRSDGANSIVQSASKPYGGSWGSVSNLSSAGRNANTARLAVDNDGNVIAIWSRYNGSNTIIQAAVKPTNGAWGTATSISLPGQNASSPEVAFEDNGNATATWERRDGSNEIVQTATRAPNGVWGSTVDLSAPGQNAFAPKLVVEPSGNATVGWYRFNGSEYIVQASSRSGGTWGSPDDLSATGGSAGGVRLANDATGNTAAAWTRYNGSNDVVQTAVKPSGGSWQTAETVSASGQNAAAPSVAFDGSENVTAIWSRSDGFNDLIQSASKPIGGAWGSTNTLSENSEDSIAPEIAIDSFGNATAIWERQFAGKYIIQSARRNDGVWGAASNLSATGEDAFYAQIAIDQNQNAYAIWARTDAGNAIVQVSFSQNTPVNTSLPTVSGTLVDGQTLSANAGSWNGIAPLAFEYQWQSCSGPSCSDIPGATSSTYPLTASDVGKAIQVIVTASNPSSLGVSATSPATSVVAAADSGGGGSSSGGEQSKGASSDAPASSGTSASSTSKTTTQPAISSQARPSLKSASLKRSRTSFTFSYRLAIASKLTARFKKLGKGCSHITQKNVKDAKAKHCKLIDVPYILTWSAKAGSGHKKINSIANDGGLPRGRYRMSVVATDATGNSSTPKYLLVTFH